MLCLQVFCITLHCHLVWKCKLECYLFKSKEHLIIEQKPFVLWSNRRFSFFGGHPVWKWIIAMILIAFRSECFLILQLPASVISMILIAFRPECFLISTTPLFCDSYDFYDPNCLSIWMFSNFYNSPSLWFLLFLWSLWSLLLCQSIWKRNRRSLRIVSFIFC